MASTPAGARSAGVFLGACETLHRGGAAEKLVERIVSNTGVSPEFVIASITALSHQADGVIKGMGIEPEAFIELTKRAHPKALEQAMVTHVGDRSLNGYRELAKEFIRVYEPGWELARTIRARHGEDRAMLIGISGKYTTGSDKVLSQLIGLDHYLVKPYAPDELLALIAPLRVAGPVVQ